MIVMPASMGVLEEEEVETSRILPVVGEKRTVAVGWTVFPSKRRTFLMRILDGGVVEGLYLVSKADGSELVTAMVDGWMSLSLHDYFELQLITKELGR